MALRLQKRIAATIAATLAMAVPSSSHAQQIYPAKPIRMLVPFSAGSLTDVLARMLGQKMFEHWGQQVVVDNRPGAGGILASQIVAASNPDGYTLIMVSARDKWGRVHFFLTARGPATPKGKTFTADGLK